MPVMEIIQERGLGRLQVLGPDESFDSVTEETYED